MNKTERLLAIVLELQGNKVVRAEDLAEKFETSVRTIYRDMQALCETGVPIIGATGQGYSLMEGYFLPPISFTVEEAVTLLLGADFIEHKFDRNYSAKAQSSRSKIESILPESVRLEASRIRNSIKLLNIKESLNSVQEKQYIEMIRHAILEKRKVRFHYSKNLPEVDGNRQSDRDAAPYGLVHVYGSWILLAKCDLRQEMRHFRLSRMSDLIILEDQFELPQDFNLLKYKPLDDRTVMVRIVVELSIADKVKESNNFFMESTEEDTDGLHVTLRVNHPDELLQWLLSWGSNVVVLEPEALRNRVRDEAEKMLKRY